LAQMNADSATIVDDRRHLPDSYRRRKRECARPAGAAHSETGHREARGGKNPAMVRGDCCGLP
jgi:hypothetical protein